MIAARLRKGPCAAGQHDHRVRAAPLRSLLAGTWANIPSKSNRNDPICLSPHLYRARNQVEWFFNRIKQCRRVATRYDKLAAGLSIEKVALVTGHKDWRTLQRYTKLKPEELHKLQTAPQPSLEEFIEALAGASLFNNQQQTHT
jgi:transposase